MAAIFVRFPAGWGGKSCSKNDSAGWGGKSISTEDSVGDLSGDKKSSLSCVYSGESNSYIKCCEAQREGIYLKEVKLFLEWKGDHELAKSINFSSDFMRQRAMLIPEFQAKNWYFNHWLVGDYDDYQRLCVRNDISGCDRFNDRFKEYHMIGSSLESDMGYHKFLFKLFDAINWNDTEKEGLEKAKEIRAASMPFIDERILCECVRECVRWRHWRKLNDEKVELLSLLYWHVIFKKQKFPQVLREINIKKRMFFPMNLTVIELDLSGTYPVGPVKVLFDSFCRYVSSQPIPKNEKKNKSKYLASQFVGKIKPVGTPSKYVEYVIKKINMANTLGFFKKEDVPSLIEREEMLSQIHY